MTTDRLSADQRKAAQRRYLSFNRLNGFSAGSLMEDVLILYAIRNGLTVWQISLMASFLYLSTPAILIGKSVVQRRGATRTACDAWCLRGMCALAMALAPWLSGLVPRALHHAALLAAIFGLFAFRSVGMAALPQLVSWITTESDRARFISRAWADTRLLQLIGTLFMVGLLGLVARRLPGREMEAFQAAILIGAVFSAVAGRQLRRIVEPPMAREWAGQSVRAAWRALGANRDKRRLLIAQAAAFSAIMLVAPFSTLAVKQAYRMPDPWVIGLTLVSIVSVVVTSRHIAAHSDARGPNSLMTLCMGGLGVVCLLWLLAGRSASLFVLVPLYLLLGIAATGIQIAASHAFHTVTEECDKVASGILFQTIPCLVGGASAVIGGWLLQSLGGRVTDAHLLYRLYFGVVLLAMIPLTWLTCRIPAAQRNPAPR